MKKILILSPFFYPEPISTGKYNTEFANHLANNSFDVSVLCCHPIYPRWIVEKTDKKLKNIKIKRGGAFLKFPNNKYVRRAILELWFFLFILINLRELFKQDIIIAVLPPSLFMTTFIFLPKKIKKIGIVHDLQNIHLGKKTSLFKNIINKLIYFIERSAFKRCENLIYLSNEMLEYATNEYKLHDKKSDVLYPFITLDSFSNNRNLDYNFSDKNFNIVYSGALGEKQNPDALYEIALSVIKKAKEARFIFFSEGSNFQKLKKNNHEKHILFFDLAKQEDLGELLIRSDIQILPQAPGTSSGSLPSKLPNILASGTQIYCITDKDSEISTLLSSQPGCTVSFNWNIEYNANLLISKILEGSSKFDRSGNLKKYNKDFIIDLINGEMK